MPPLLAFLLLVSQSFRLPGGLGTQPVNILFLGLELASFLPLIVKSRDARLGTHLTGMAASTFLAIIYDVHIAELPIPTSSVPAYLMSWYGTWTLIVVVQIVALCFLALWRTSGSGGVSLKPPAQPKQISTERQSDTGADNTSAAPAGADVSGSSAPHPKNAPPVSDRKQISFGTKALVIGYIAVGILFPFLPVHQLNGWITAVKEITTAFYGSIVDTLPDSVVVIAFFIFIFVIVVGGYVLWQLALHVLEQLKEGTSAEKDFFKEYSTPITMLVVVIALIISARQMDPSDTGNTTDWLKLVGELFSWLFIVIMAIIAAFVVFETMRLLLEQCMERGSLIKTSMHLIFVLVVDQTTDLLIGLLRVFALRSAVESILSFFLPDQIDSITPDIDQVRKKSLKREVDRVSEASKRKYEEDGPQRHMRSKRGWYRYGKGGGRHET